MGCLFRLAENPAKQDSFYSKTGNIPDIFTYIKSMGPTDMKCSDIEVNRLRYVEEL